MWISFWSRPRGGVRREYPSTADHGGDVVLVDLLSPSARGLGCACCASPSSAGSSPYWISATSLECSPPARARPPCVSSSMRRVISLIRSRLSSRCSTACGQLVPNLVRLSELARPARVTSSDSAPSRRARSRAGGRAYGPLGARGPEQTVVAMCEAVRSCGRPVGLVTAVVALWQPATATLDHRRASPPDRAVLRRLRGDRGCHAPTGHRGHRASSRAAECLPSAGERLLHSDGLAEQRHWRTAEPVGVEAPPSFRYRLTCGVPNRTAPL